MASLPEALNALSKVTDILSNFLVRISFNFN